LFSNSQKKTILGYFKEGEQGQHGQGIATKLNSIVFADTGIVIVAKKPQIGVKEIMGGLTSPPQNPVIGNITKNIKHGPHASCMTEYIIPLQKATGLRIIPVFITAIFLN
jgi:hypothetical protein